MTSTLENNITRQILLCANNVLCDKEIYDYIFRTERNEKDVGTGKNKMMITKFMRADVLGYRKIVEVFFYKYNDHFVNYLPIIIFKIDEIVHDIFDIIQSDKIKYRSEYSMIKILNTNKYLDDACPICLKTPTERSLESQVVYECEHIICQKCWEDYERNMMCPLCRHDNARMITPYGLKLCNHETFENMLKQITPIFINFVNEQFHEKSK